MILRDSVEIDAPPETVFGWFAGLDRHYLEWHPDHRDCHWLKGDSLAQMGVVEARDIQ